MRVFAGREGALYLLSEPTAFKREPLLDIGDGFDWRVADPSKRFWMLGAGVSFERWDGSDWHPLEPLEVHPRAGRVGFGRCYRGQHLSASGVCQPAVEVVAAEAWRLAVSFNQGDVSTFGSEAQEFASRPSDARVSLESVRLRDRALVSPHLGDRLLALMPHMSGAFAGFGVLDGPSVAALRAGATDMAVNVHFEPGEVQYVLV